MQVLPPRDTTEKDDQRLSKGQHASMTERLDQLTSLRFFAAAAIVAVHIQQVILRIPGTDWLGWGVSFFFVLSGFILTYVYGDMSGKTTSRFFVARIARLWPLHAFMLVAHFGFVWDWNVTKLGPQTFSNALMLHAWIPSLNFSLSHNAVSWSISAEIFFYLLFPFAARSKHLWLWILVFLVIPAALSYWINSNFNWLNEIMRNPLPAFLSKSPYGSAVEFLVGVGAGRIYIATKGRRLIPDVAWTWLEIISISLLVASAASISDVSTWVGRVTVLPLGFWFSHSGGMLVFAGLIYTMAMGRGVISNALKARPLILLGEISFAIYMTHWTIIHFVRRKASQWQWQPFMMALVVIVVTLAVSYVLWRFLEMPARSWIISRFDRRSGRLKRAQPD
jgi:peptidoglycan/LPS O-acetylase OafA/YrhL